MKIRKLFGILLFVLPLTFFACGDPLPINEIVAARSALDLDIQVKADKYFPAEYAAVSSDFNSLHQMIVDGADLNKVKSSAESITKRANELYAKSLPLAAKEYIDAAEELMEEAVNVNADIFFQNEFNSAKALFENAVSEYENKEYDQACDSAYEAKVQFENLKTDAIIQRDILKDAITEVINTLAEAEEFNSSVYAAEIVELALLNLETAQQCYENMEIKKGFAALEAAKANADEALAISLECMAKDELAIARDTIDKAKNSEGALEAEDEIDAAEELYLNAELSFEDERFPESIEFSREASKLAAIALGLDEGSVVSHSGKNQSAFEYEDDGDYVIYKVQKRVQHTDTLWGIANKFYQNPRLWTKIYDANKDVIKNPNRIYPGQVLKIPKKK
jgi:nucleoid-associated protein YgaU